MTNPKPKVADAFAEQNEAAQAIAVDKIQTPLKSEIDSLPDEVKKSLSGYDDLVADQRILEILQNGSNFTVDKIILALWHKFKFHEPRAKVQSRLRNLVKNNEITKVEGSRGTYRIKGLL